MNYTVTAKSNIGPVGYTIALEVVEKNVPTYLVKGVLYEAQRMAASKAVKALGGGKRDNIVYGDEARVAVEAALKEVFGEDAEITCSEHVKGVKPVIKFAAEHKLLDAKVGKWDKIAETVGFEGDSTERSVEFLQAIHDWREARFEALGDEEENA